MKLIIPGFLFLVSALSLIITVSILLLITTPSYTDLEMNFFTLITGLICSVSIFYISLFSGLLIILHPKLKIITTTAL